MKNATHLLHLCHSVVSTQMAGRTVKVQEKTASDKITCTFTTASVIQIRSVNR